MRPSFLSIQSSEKPLVRIEVELGTDLRARTRAAIALIHPVAGGTRALPSLLLRAGCGARGSARSFRSPP